MSKLIVIVGPTASGKSDLAVLLAKKFNGEVVSADSRQVYKGMDIGTGKVPRDSMFKKSDLPNIDVNNWEVGLPYVYKGVRHHLLDVANPKRTFTVAQYQKLARRAIEDIWKRGKLPILCGGTGFYVDAVVDGTVIPEVKPNTALRKQLERKTTEELYQQLQILDPRRAKNIDRYNRRRLVRALEIVLTTGKPIPLLRTLNVWKSDFQNVDVNVKEVGLPRINVLKIGITKDKRTLRKLIEKRLMKRMKQGMVAEVKRLHRKGVSWKRLEDFGLEYRHIARYLRHKISKQEMIETIQKETRQYAKRQMTWFKKNKNIHWVKNQQEAMQFISIKNPAP